MRSWNCSGPMSRESPREIEKLSLYAGTERRITEEDIFSLAPSAKASTIFALVNALGRNDRTGIAGIAGRAGARRRISAPRACRSWRRSFGWPIVAKEARLSNASQIQAYFTKQGTPMWRSRAEQVAQTAAAFSVEKLRTAAIKIYETDKALRDARPDDRTVMERFVLELTGNLSGGSGKLANVRGQAGLVPGGRVLLDDSPLGGAVDHRVSLGKLCLSAVSVIGRHQTAQLTNLGPQTALTKPIHGRFTLGLSHPLQRGNGICHPVKIQSLQRLYFLTGYPMHASLRKPRMLAHTSESLNYLALATGCLLALGGRVVPHAAFSTSASCFLTFRRPVLPEPASGKVRIFSAASG